MIVYPLKPTLTTIKHKGQYNEPLPCNEALNGTYAVLIQHLDDPNIRIWRHADDAKAVISRSDNPGAS